MSFGHTHIILGSYFPGFHIILGSHPAGLIHILGLYPLGLILGSYPHGLTHILGLCPPRLTHILGSYPVGFISWDHILLDLFTSLSFHMFWVPSGLSGDSRIFLAVFSSSCSNIFPGTLAAFWGHSQLPGTVHDVLGSLYSNFTRNIQNSWFPWQAFSPSVTFYGDLLFCC